MTQQQTQPPVAAIFDSNEIIRKMLTQANERQPLALQILRECMTNAKQILLKAQRIGRNPGINSFLNGERIEWSWQRRDCGAIEQCLFLATLVYADIARNSAPPSGVSLSQSGLAIDGSVLVDLMRFVATDSHTRFGAPFPYAQSEMKQAFDEHAKHAKER